MYCGTSILIEEGGEKFTYRKIDEARIKEAESRERLRVLELEQAEKSRAFKVKATIALAVVGLLLIVAGLPFMEEDKPAAMLTIIGFFPLMGILPVWSDRNSKDDK